MARILVFLAFLIISTTSFSQIRNVPIQVEDAFRQKYPEAREVEYQDNLLNVQVNFELDGEKMMATFNNKGMWKETEKDWTFEQLSEEVKDGFKKSKFADWKVMETRVVYRPDGKERYRVKVTKGDFQKKSLLFNTEGRLIEDLITF